MRAEGIVGCTFFAGVFVGLVLIITGLKRKEDRPRVNAGLAVERLTFLFFGLVTFYFVRTSPRLETEGNNWESHRVQARSGGSNFRVRGWRSVGLD